MSMWDSKFGQSPIIKYFKTEIETLLNFGVSPPNFEDTKDDIRAITGYSDEDYIGCFENDYVYQFDDSSTLSDNDDDVLTPDDITEPDPGRWLKIKYYSLGGHTHIDKADKVTGAVDGNFAGLDSEGNLIDLGTKPDAFIAKKGEATDGYIPLFDENGDLQDEGIDPDTLDPGTALEEKMDKIDEIETGEVGMIPVFDADRNVQISGYKPVDTSFDWSDPGIEWTDRDVTTAPVDCKALISSDDDYIYFNIGANYFVRLPKTTTSTGDPF